MTLSQDLWNRITIIITLDILHNNFDIIIASFLEIGNKIIDQIQNILQSKKAKNHSKRLIGTIEDLIMVFKDNN